MGRIHRRLLQCVIVGVLVGSVLRIAFFSQTDPQFGYTEAPSNLQSETARSRPSDTRAVKSPQEMEVMLKRMIATERDAAPKVSEAIDAPLSVNDWTSIRLRIIERTHDPSLCEKVIDELKLLKSAAYVPGTGSASAVQPVDKLIQYVFTAWTKDDPHHAMELERKWNEPPTVYWAPFEAIQMEWRKSDPEAALVALIERMESEPVSNLYHPGGGAIWACGTQNPAFLFEQTQDIRHPWMISTVGHLAQHWRGVDPDAMEAWFQMHPDHPVTSEKSFRQAMAEKTERK